MSEKRIVTALYSWVQGSFWMSFCVSVSFAAVYLQGLGYDNTTLGLILACGNLLGALLGPALSSLVDRKRIVSAARLIPALLFAQGLCLVLLLSFPQRCAVTALAYVAFIAFSLSVNSMNLKLYVDFSYRGVTINYGLTRGMGSLAFVLASTLLGVLTERLSVRILPIAGLALTLLQFTAHLCLCRHLPPEGDGERMQRETGSVFAFLRTHRRFGVLLAGTALVFFAHNTVSSFLINITRAVGGSTEDMGYINSFMAAVEIPVMLLFTSLFGRRRISSLLRAAFCFFVLKTAAVALAPSVPALYAAFLLQAPSFALYTAAIVPYTAQMIDYADAAKAQSLAFSMTTLGSVLASLISGWLLDRVSVAATLGIAVGVCVLGAAIACLGVADGRKSREK